MSGKAIDEQGVPTTFCANSASIPTKLAAALPACLNIIRGNEFSEDWRVFGGASYECRQGCRYEENSKFKAIG
jgi:hypothetical protein